MRSRCWRGKSQRPSANTTKWKRRLSAATMQTRRDFTEAAPISLRHAALGHTVTLLRKHSIDQSTGLEENPAVFRNAKGAKLLRARSPTGKRAEALSRPREPLEHVVQVSLESPHKR